MVTYEEEMKRLPSCAEVARAAIQDYVKILLQMAPPQAIALHAARYPKDLSEYAQTTLIDMATDLRRAIARQNVEKANADVKVSPVV
jgi:hypothetical protein